MFHYIRKRGPLPVCLLVSAFLLCACDSSEPRATAPPKVYFTVLREEPLTLVTELPGRVSAYELSEVRPQISGIIQKRFFEEGADVAEGETLYQIDPALFKADVDNARANLARAKATVESARLLAERYQKLITIHAISKQECDDATAARQQAEADVRAAEEALTMAEINLGYTRVTAPVTGRIGRSYVTPGALVTRNQDDSLATIQHLDVVYIDVHQANADLLRVARAMQGNGNASGGKASARVRLRLEDGTPYARGMLAANGGHEPEWIEGEFLFSEVSVNKGTGEVALRTAFPNPDHILLPGMHVRASLVEGIVESALLIPQRSVMRDSEGKAFVYILREDAPNPAAGNQHFTVERRPVEIARSIGNRWLVSSGLAPGERLLFEGHMKARPGQTVLGTDVGANAVFSAGIGSSWNVR